LKVRQDSWIDVRAGNNSLISRLVKAGSTEQLQIAEPTSVILGNAAGVDVIFRGSPLEIKSDAKNNVARLSLK
jgi:cytoskeleton protein RodZ